MLIDPYGAGAMTLDQMKESMDRHRIERQELERQLHVAEEISPGNSRWSLR